MPLPANNLVVIWGSERKKTLKLKINAGKIFSTFATRGEHSHTLFLKASRIFKSLYCPAHFINSLADTGASAEQLYCCSHISRVGSPHHHTVVECKWCLSSPLASLQKRDQVQCCTPKKDPQPVYGLLKSYPPSCTDDLSLHS